MLVSTAKKCVRWWVLFVLGAYSANSPSSRGEPLRVATSHPGANDAFDGTAVADTAQSSSPIGSAHRPINAAATTTSTRATAKFGATSSTSTRIVQPATRTTATSATAPQPTPSGRLSDYASFIHVPSRTRLFYWFFCSRRSSQRTDPLVVWLQGQPNASAAYGAFDETGPFYADARTKKGGGKRLHSWTRTSNVLYLDPYPGCGFSRSDDAADYALTYPRVAKLIITALKRFYRRHPQLMANDLYVAAQSVGAKYAVVVAYAICRMNALLGQRLRLKGLILGGAVIDERQLANYHYRMFAFGLLDAKTTQTVADHEEYAIALIRAKKYDSATDYLRRHVFGAFERAGYRSAYDVRAVNAFWSSAVPIFLNSAQARKTLGVSDDEAKFQPAAEIYVTAETLRPVRVLLRELLANIKVLLYHGQYDMFAPYTHTTDFLNEFVWPGNFDFYVSRRHNWFVNKKLAGFWSNWQNLTVLLIRNAGHTVGSTQPACMLQMLNDFVSNKFQVRIG